MHLLLLLFLIFFIPLSFFLAWMAISSCLGSGFRARFSRASFMPGLDSYGRTYLQAISGNSPAMSEQIELEDMLAESDHEQ